MDEDFETAVLRQFTETSSKSPTLLPWDRFSNWLHCACVVTFDLELGQAMEVEYGFRITKAGFYHCVAPNSVDIFQIF